MIIHGDGQHSGRYIYAGDAADAFDTIPHRGQFGQVYNIGSVDEVTNLELCAKLPAVFNMSQTESGDWIEHTKGRPFNDHRHTVDGTEKAPVPKTTSANALRNSPEITAMRKIIIDMVM